MASSGGMWTHMKGKPGNRVFLTKEVLARTGDTIEWLRSDGITTGSLDYGRADAGLLKKRGELVAKDTGLRKDLAGVGSDTIKRRSILQVINANVEEIRRLDRRRADLFRRYVKPKPKPETKRPIGGSSVSPGYEPGMVARHAYRSGAR